MFAHFASKRFAEIIRYYQAGIINTAFGLGAYAALIWVGVGIYPAQLIAHLLGIGFNYATYSRHVFRDASPAKGRFVLSYVANYLLSLVTLAIVAQFVVNPYLAGLLSAGIVSVVNYFALKYVVFSTGAP